MVLEEHEPQRSPNVAKVFVNGARIGVHCNAAHLVRAVQHLRRTHLISHEVGLVGDIYDLEFKIFIDVGRVRRPLSVIDNNLELWEFRPQKISSSNLKEVVPVVRSPIKLLS